MQALETLASFCERHDLPWDAATEQRFVTYVELLEQFNANMNLIGPLQRQQIVDELLIDSIAPAVLEPPSGSLLDIGSGAGLPGIPLKILYPDVAITLVEPRQKRATFLRIAAKRLGLEDVTVHADRIESIEVPRHEVLISKAFRPPTDWIVTAAGHVAPGGLIVCLHAADQTEAARECARGLGLVETGHVDDVRTGLAAPVPAGRAVTVFRAP